MPLGLLILAGLIKTFFKVRIYKPKIKLINADDYVSAAKDILKSKPSLIGFSTWCVTYPALLLVAKEIKKIAPQVPIVFGGPQASILAFETLNNFPFIDYILVGEADFSLPVFIDTVLNGKDNFDKIPGLVYRANKGRIIQNSLPEPILNTDDLPIPDYQCTPFSKVINLDVGRGCPFNCTFCTTNTFFSKKYRLKTASRIVDEMKTLNRATGIKKFSFIHDMFTLNRKTVIDLCDQLIELQINENLYFKWSCSARTDCISKDLLSKMKKAGCDAIFFGIESGSEKIQISIKKNLHLRNVYELADHCNDIGMRMFASFIIGFPDETKSDIKQTLKCIARLAIKGVSVQISELTLLPGTSLFENHKEKLRLDGSFSNFSKTLCGPEEIQLIRDHPHIFSSFYYLPIKPVKRSKIVFINQLINKISLFRNTLMLISVHLEKEIEKLNLLKLAENEFENIVSTNKIQIPAVSHLIRIIAKLISEKIPKNEMPYLMSIFNLESYQALLKTLYSGWQHFNKKNRNGTFTNESIIYPTPLWKVLTTKFDAIKIASYLNNPNRQKIRLKVGSYHYLVFVKSEKICKTVKINVKELFLLNNLCQLSVNEYAEKVKPVINNTELLLWLKRLERNGIIELKSTTIN